MAGERKKVNHVFVYGTLKEGRPLDRKIFADIRLSVKPATIVGKLYNMMYPAVKLKGKSLVQGEIHEFDPKDVKEVIRIMDAIEGYREGKPDKESLYARRIVKAETDDGEKIDVFMYEYCHEVDEERLVDDGLWEPS
jgi:gamma-glutamylcyclotransferase (GGCT)/AIG2-like uncharacterized protein YtfP